MVKNELIYNIKDYKYSEALQLLKILDDNTINSYDILEDNPLYIMCDIYNNIIYNKYYLNNYNIINNKKNHKDEKYTLNYIIDNTQSFYALFNELIRRNIQLNYDDSKKHRIYKDLIYLCTLLNMTKFFHQNENNQINYDNFVNIPLLIDYLINNNIHNNNNIYDGIPIKCIFLHYLLNNYNILNENQLNIMYELINQYWHNEVIDGYFISRFININNYKVLNLLKDKYTFKLNNLLNCISFNYSISYVDYSINQKYMILYKQYNSTEYNKMIDTFINLGYNIKTDKYTSYKVSLLYNLIELNLFDIAEKIIKDNVYIHYNNEYIYINFNKSNFYPLYHLIRKYIENDNITNKPYFTNILQYYLDKKVYCDNELIKYLINCNSNETEELLKLILSNYKNIDLTIDTHNFHNSFIYQTLINHKYNLTIILLENNAFCSYDFITFDKSLIYFVLKLINGVKDKDISNNELDKFYQPLINNKPIINISKNKISEYSKNNDYKLLINIIKLIYNKDNNYNIEMLKSNLSKKIVNFIIN